MFLMLMLALSSYADDWKAWRDCIPNSIGPGGCDSIGPGGGKSIGPGGGLSIGPGGGMSIGPGGGQSIAPGGGQSIAPGGGKSLTRDRSRGLDPDTLRPYPEMLRGVEMPSNSANPQSTPSIVNEGVGAADLTTNPIPVIRAAPQQPQIDYRQFDSAAQILQSSNDSDQLRRTYSTMRVEGEKIIHTRTQFLIAYSNYSYPNEPGKAKQQAQNAIQMDSEIQDVKSRLNEAARTVRMKLAIP